MQKRIVTGSILIAVGFMAHIDAGQRGPLQAGPKQLIAHRGASGYAPEHTIAAYQLAHGPEGGLRRARPGGLEGRRPRLPARRHARADDQRRGRVPRSLQPRTASGANGAKQWIANDFTVAEIKQLDAGSWRDPKFAGARVPTWDEMVGLVRGKAGIYPELKSPPLYTEARASTW